MQKFLLTKNKDDIRGDKAIQLLLTAGKPVQRNMNQFTTLSAQQLLANASGLALKANPIPRI